MKKWLMPALALLLAVAAFGCEINEKEQGQHYKESESITAAAEASDYNTLLKELKREISILVFDARPIGPEHYQKLKERLQMLAGKGLPEEELAGLEQKLETLNSEKKEKAGSSQQQESEPGHTGQSNELEDLKREINILAQDAGQIGPEHYGRLDERLQQQ